MTVDDIDNYRSAKTLIERYGDDMRRCLKMFMAKSRVYALQTL